MDFDMFSHLPFSKHNYTVRLDDQPLGGSCMLVGWLVRS